jgi:hypothetical protein
MRRLACRAPGHRCWLPGSGKTSLTVKLGRKLCLPVVHLDMLYWRPGWKASDKAGFRARVANARAKVGSSTAGSRGWPSIPP